MTALNINKLFNLPNILIIILNYGKNGVYKCNVNFPEVIDLHSYVQNGIITIMELYGVISHIGESSMSGHFVAYCKNKINRKWYIYNDSRVEICKNEKDYLNYMPYILFYRKYE